MKKLLSFFLTIGCVGESTHTQIEEPTQRELLDARCRPTHVIGSSPDPVVQQLMHGMAKDHCYSQNQCLKRLVYKADRNHYNAICGGY